MPILIPVRIVAARHRPIVRRRIPSRATAARLRCRAIRLRAHPVRRPVIAAIPETPRHPTAALQHRERIGREGVVREGVRADLAVAAALPAARAAEVAVLPEAVRPEDVRGVPPAAVSESKQSKAEWRGLP